MPLFIYENDDGSVRDEVIAEAGKLPKFIIRQGQRLYPVFARPTHNRGWTQGSTGYWQLSRSNGFIGTKEQLAQQVAIDKANGAPDIDYVAVKSKGDRHVFRAAYDNPYHKAKWLRGTKRYDLDPSHGAPSPGDFRGQVPPEFYGMKVPE